MRPASASGRSTSMPNWSTMYAASSAESAMFFGVSGSIAGGQMNASRQAAGRAARTRACGRSPRRSARATARASRARSRFGVERSMWQRQIQCAARVREVVDHRRGLRVVDDDEVVLVVELLCVDRVVALEDLLPASSVRPCGSPWSALWIFFVTSKNSSWPWMMRHSTSSPASLHQRDQRVVDLCNAAAERRGREVADPLALERPGEARISPSDRGR